MSPADFSPQRVREIAVVALVDPRSVRRYLDGKPVRASLRERIEKALATMGLGAVVMTNGSNGKEG